ncbi:hypothetical protein BH23GEM9_BH23GEM9_16790 [soil metagenome]
MGRTLSRLHGTAVVIALAAVFLAVLPATHVVAHEIPATVRVAAFVKPEAGRLRVLVRVPLESMRDIDFPQYGAGFLDIAATERVLTAAAALWIAGYLDAYEGDSPLIGAVTATRISLPSDMSFASYDLAMAHIGGARLPPETQLPWQQALLDVVIEYEIVSDHSDFSIRPGLAHLGLTTTTVLRFLPAGGTERAFHYTGDPGLVRLDPRWHQAVFSFVKLGFLHIMDGLDHLLFVLCLVIPFRRFRPLLVVVTSFTVAHSITLVASAFGLAPTALWFPPLVEMLIALSIVFMAFENIVGPNLQRRWATAFIFGLVHGFGFSFLLRDSLQFAGTHLVTSLLAFNVGVELGQVVVLLVTIPALTLLFRHLVAERIGTILLSALVAHTAWHWMTERGGELREYAFEWPAMDALLLASLMRWLMLLLVTVGAVWLLRSLAGRLTAPAAAPAAAQRVAAGTD